MKLCHACETLNFLYASEVTDTSQLRPCNMKKPVTIQKNVNVRKVQPRNLKKCA